MELGLQNAHYSTLTLRVPTLRLLRTHHPYKRVLYIDNLPLQAHVDLFGEDLDRFLAADPWLPLQHEPQLPHLRQRNPGQDHRDRNRDGDVAGVEPQQGVQLGWILRFLKYLLSIVVPALILFIAFNV
ncbi:hypothetical protein VKT23_009131 [Stygiomarasmius scandens]|uniref:Uncharacterized protein n=1 Tax=Marasmiellus scandens TaxID=2682957 RepID=A0ABR1JJ68_9AGAR